MSNTRLTLIHQTIKDCRACPKMVGPPVHGCDVASSLFLLGQAPGPHEAKKGRPFAHTAGKTLFRWFHETTGIDEDLFRAHVYMAAVARCFPGKGKGGGDRVPDSSEIASCSGHLRTELSILRPKLILAVGKLAIGQVLGPQRFRSDSRLTDVIGKLFEAQFHGHNSEVICLPHPSGLSSWHKTEPGKSLLASSLRLIKYHPEWRKAFKL